MEREDLIGKIVISKAGRDSGKYFIIVGIVGNGYVLIADGCLRTIEKSKKKKLRHLNFTDIIAKEIKDDLMLGKQVMNSKIRNVLRLDDFDKEV